MICSGTVSAAKERDSETGLDYFGASYLSAAQGRVYEPRSAVKFRAAIGAASLGIDMRTP
jgi:hypothetical protein